MYLYSFVEFQSTANVLSARWNRKQWTDMKGSGLHPKLQGIRTHTALGQNNQNLDTMKISFFPYNYNTQANSVRVSGVRHFRSVTDRK